MPVVILAVPAPWPMQPAELSRRLHLQPGPTMTCHGQTKACSACRNPLSRANVSEIERLVREIAAAASSLEDAVLRRLQELATLVLCVRWHRDQAALKLQTWLDDLQPSGPGPADDMASKRAGKRPAVRPHPAAAPSSTPGTHRETERRDGEPRPRRAENTSTGGHRTYTPTGRACGSCDNDNPSSGRPTARSTTPEPPTAGGWPRASEAHPVPGGIGHWGRDGSPPSRNTRSRGSSPPRPRAAAGPPRTAHTFYPYGPHKSPRQLGEEMRALVARPLTAQEQGDGHVYGYTFPAPHTVGGGGGGGESPAGLVKVGRTRDVGRRMGEVARACGYAPRVLFASPAVPHAPRLERLVHLALHNGRRRERACPGCLRGHIEWFCLADVEGGGEAGAGAGGAGAGAGEGRAAAAAAAGTVGAVEAMARMWAGWVALRPYDADGRLKGVWRDRLDAVDLDRPDCWLEFVRPPSGRRAAAAPCASSSSSSRYGAPQGARPRPSGGGPAARGCPCCAAPGASYAQTGRSGTGHHGCRG